jgi:hypothetical protein
MNAIEHLQETIWETPGSYFGHNPVGHYCVASQNRDSDSVTRSNYACILRDLEKLALEHDAADRDEPSVYTFRASHWACGWIEYVIVLNDAPEAVLEAAGEAICALADYPVYDDEHHSELELTEAADYWARLDVRERAELIRDTQCGASIFAARRDELPTDDSGALLERLTSN